MIEYVMMAALIAVVAISSVEAVGQEALSVTNKIAKKMDTGGTEIPDEDIPDEDW